MVRKTLVAALGILLCSSCAPSRTADVRKVKLPDAYEAAPDQQPVESIPWKDYFQDPQLVELVTLAVKYNYDLRIALQRIEVARAGVRRATGAWVPQVGLATGVGVRKFGLYTMDGAGNAATEIRPGQTVPVHLPDFYVGLQASWEVNLAGRMRHLQESAKARYLATVEGANLVITSLVADVAVAYYELAAVDRSLEVVRQTLVRQEEALEAMRVQKAAGLTNELAVQQFAGQLADTRALQAKLTQQSRTIENQLNLLVGRLPQSIRRPDDALTRDVEDPAPLGVPSDLLRNRPDIRAAEHRMRAAGWDVKAARAAFYPSIRITSGVGYQAFNPKFLFATPASIAYSVAGGLVAPLVNRSAINAEFDSASALQVQAMYEYQSAILSGFIDVASSLATVEQVNEIVEHRTTQLDALGETIATADLLFEAGQASYLEVLTAQQNALAAELELIEALKVQRISRLLLYKAVGGGWR
jgi:NodT family efflux transporter outer membrane factor (OMF) lipoprotein